MYITYYSTKSYSSQPNNLQELPLSDHYSELHEICREINVDVIPNLKALEAEAEDKDNKSILTISDDFASATSLSNDDYEALSTIISNKQNESSYTKSDEAKGEL